MGLKRQTPPSPPEGGHTRGLVGSFLVETADADPFLASLENFGRRLQDPNATLLEREILTPQEWIQDPYYSGSLSREVWPQKVRDFIQIAEGDTTEICLTGCIGSGKTQLLKMVAAYDLYRISCFKNPQQALGIGSSETLLFVMVSMSILKARAKMLMPLRQMIQAIPYFRDNFMFDKRRDVDMLFPKKVKVTAGVTGEGAVHSEDVVWIGVSECNFLPVVKDSKKKRGVEELDVAADLLDAVIRRMTSRFMQGGRLPLCRIVLDSSRQYPDDFLERRIKEISAGQVHHKAQVISRSIWEAKAGVTTASGEPFFSDVTFPVEVGTDQRSSRILHTDEVEFASGEVIHVPVELRPQFEQDIEGSIRDLAGRAVLALRQLIPNQDAVRECIRTESSIYPAATCAHPFTAQATTLRDAVKLVEANLVNPATGLPWKSPDRYRAVHIDVGLTGDALGFAMGHIDEMVMVTRGGRGTEGLNCLRCFGDGSIQCPRCEGKGHKRHWGNQVKCATCQGKKQLTCAACGGTGAYGSQVVRPRVFMDLVLQVVPPETGEIQFDDVEALLQNLRNLGFKIPVVTADGTYSVQFLQRQQNQYGVPYAEKLSVDKTKDAYYAVRDAIYDVAVDGARRLSFYSYPILEFELSRLEETPKKIDHPPAKGNSKDVADAMAGVVQSCETIPALQQRDKPGAITVKQW